MRRCIGCLFTLGCFLLLSTVASAERLDSVAIYYRTGNNDSTPPPNQMPSSVAYFDLARDRCAFTQYSITAPSPLSKRIITPGKSFEINYLRKIAIEIPHDSPRRKCLFAEEPETHQLDEKTILGRTCRVVDMGLMTICRWNGITLESAMAMGATKLSTRATRIEENVTIAESEFELPAEIKIVSFTKGLGLALGDLVGAVQEAQKNDPQLLEKLRQGLDKLTEQEKETPTH